MRWWQVSALCAVTALLGLATGSRPLLVAALALLVLLVSGLLYRQVLAGAVTGASTNADVTVEWGETYHHTMRLRNTAPLPIPYVRVVLKAGPSMGAYGFVTSLAPQAEPVRRQVDVPCYARGRYQVGPVVTHMSDPMGLFTVEREIGDVSNVLVLPRCVPLNRSALPLDGQLPGEIRGRRRGRRHGDSPPEVAGLRDYVIGDSLAAIHWPATARAGRPITKVFEPEAQTVLWLALDLDSKLPTGCEELLVTVAASLGRYALRRVGLRVGVIASGERSMVLLAQGGRRQESRLLESLADVRAGGAASLNLSDRRIGSGHTVTLLTGRGPDVWDDRLRQLQRRGVVTGVISTCVSSGKWQAPHIDLPVALNDLSREQELVRALEYGPVDVSG